MSSRVYVALRMRAPRERVFDASVNEIGAWWRPDRTFATTPRPPGRLAFEPGEGGRLTETLANGKVFEIGRITAWDPPGRLVFTWRHATFPPDLFTEVEVRFEAAGEETRVSVEHRGFDRVPLDSAARHDFADDVLLMRLAERWRGLLTSLAETLPKACP